MEKNKTPVIPTQTGAEGVVWDLSMFYKSYDDPKIKEDISHIFKLAKRFKKNYEGKVAKKFGKAIEDYSEINAYMDKILSYLYLLKSVNTGDMKIANEIVHVSNIFQIDVEKIIDFFDSEYLSMQKRTRQRLYREDPVARKHKTWVESAIDQSRHTLGYDVETALSKRINSGPYTWSNFYETVEGITDFIFRGEKYSLQGMLDISRYHSDRDVRREALKVLNETLKGFFSLYSAEALNNIIMYHHVDILDRKYKSPIEEANANNKMDDDVVKKLHDSVEKYAVPYMKRYYDLMKQILRYDHLQFSDYLAPISLGEDMKVSFDEAIDVIIKAYGRFSPTLAEIVADLVAKKRIHASPAFGKSSGAFAYPVAIPEEPISAFVLLTFSGKFKDIGYLAHEFGHASQWVYAGRYNSSLTTFPGTVVAETGSIFGEMITFDYMRKELLKRGDEATWLSILMASIKDTIYNVVRPISLSLFEQRLHGADETFTKWSRPRKHSVQEINNLWIYYQKRFFGGEGEIFKYENMDHLWSHVTHFHSPFYMYSYAAGQLFTHSIYAQKRKFGKDFEKMYLNLLKAGDTKTPAQLLRPFGLDIHDEKFWANAIKVGLGRMINEAEVLAKKLGYIQ